MGLDFIEVTTSNPYQRSRPVRRRDSGFDDGLCNCHRMLHRADPLENLDALRERFGVGDGK
jgi:predicted HNH restriction endonuclease